MAGAWRTMAELDDEAAWSNSFVCWPSFRAGAHGAGRFLENPPEGATGRATNADEARRPSRAVRCFTRRPEHTHQTGYGGNEVKPPSSYVCPYYVRCGPLALHRYPERKAIPSYRGTCCCQWKTRTAIATRKEHDEYFLDLVVVALGISCGTEKERRDTKQKREKRERKKETFHVHISLTSLPFFNPAGAEQALPRHPSPSLPPSCRPSAIAIATPVSLSKK